MNTLPPKIMEDFQGELEEMISYIESKKIKVVPTNPNTLPQTIPQTEEELRIQGTKKLNAALDYLRLQIKYVVFDLEATRRENNYLRKIIDDTSSE